MAVHSWLRTGLVLAVLFGARVGSTTQDAHTESAVSVAWYEDSPSQSPPGETDVAMAYDAASSQLIMFGGYDGSSTNDETWEWNGANWTQLSPASSPPSLDGAAMAYDPVDDDLILFGGSASGSYDGGTWAWNGTTWSELSTTGPSARSFASMAYDSSTQRMVLFGGVDTSGALDDTWIWSAGTDTWSALTPATSPPAEDSASMSYDSDTDEVVLFGGTNASTEFDDTWTWNGTTWDLATNSGPSAREGASMTYDPAVSGLVLFGGYSGSSELDDTWTWDGTAWSTGPATGPYAREFAGMAYDGATSEVVLQGGYALRYLYDTWIVGPPTVSSVSPLSATPAGASTVTITGGGFTGATSVDFGTTPGTIVSISADGTVLTATDPQGDDGQTADVKVTGPTGTSYVTSADEFSWFYPWYPAPSATSPPARSDFAEAYDPASSQLVAYGGESVSGDLADTWKWSGSTWVQASPATSPPALADASMAYDPNMASGELLLFGGEDGSTYESATWAWNGSDWSNVSNSGPAARSDASLAYDIATSQMILFGGQGSSGGYSDTWGWNGTSWTELSSSSAIGQLHSASMSYDPWASQLVLFGGNNGSSNEDDTWQWTGSAWSLLDPTNSPPAASESPIAADSLVSELVMFDSTNNETWTWNGTNWSQVTPSQSPGDRIATALAYDANTAQLVLFGGNNGGYLDDTWVLAPPEVTGVSPAAGPMSGGSSVVISGTGFTAATAVYFGSDPATSYTVESGDQIVATAPAGSGTEDVTVTNPDAASAVSSADHYTFENAPSVTAVSPDTGPETGASTAVITGINFIDATSVEFGTFADASGDWTVNSAGTQITVTKTPAGIGSVDVIVTSPVGSSPVNRPGDVFTYTATPSAPTTVSVTTEGCGASLSWAAPESDGGASISRYDVFVATSQAAALSATKPTITTTATSATITGLDCDTKYYFVVRAINSAGVGAPSSVLSTTTSSLLSQCSANGYWEDATDGGIFSFGDARFYGSMGDMRLNQPMVGMAATEDCKGYWLVASDGGIFSFGDARFYGSMGDKRLNKPIVAMASTPDGKGYWLVASDGGIFSFGDARFYGSMGDKHLNQPVVGMAPTPNGDGYWLVASDGGIFSFGDARFYGSMGDKRLNKPVVGMAATHDGKGYWFVASDGGIFSFGNAHFYGSMGDRRLNAPVVGIASTPDGEGYWFVASDGGIFNYGDTRFYGSMGGHHLNKPVVGMAC